MNAVTKVFVSGSLNQAIFLDSEGLKILNGCDSSVRFPHKNEVNLFFDCAQSIKPLDETACEWSVEKLRSELEHERVYFTALDGLLIGMDFEYPSELRARWMRRSDEYLRNNDALIPLICKKFLVPANTQEWDYHGAASIARENQLDKTAWMYEQLSAGYVDACCDCIETVVFDKGSGSSLSNRDLVNTIIQVGLVGDILYFLSQGQSPKLNNFIFENKNSLFSEIGLNLQLLSSIIAKINRNECLKPLLSSAQPHNNTPHLNDVVVDEVNINDDLTLEGKLLWAKDCISVRSHADSRHFDSLEKVQKTINYIVRNFEKDTTAQTTRKIFELIDDQVKNSKFTDIIKSVTSIAHSLKKNNSLEFSLEIYQALIKFEVDVVARNGRAEVLRVLGRNEEALSAYSDTMDRFPADVVARNGLASLYSLMCDYKSTIALLANTVENPHTQDDWIAVHIVGMAYLRQNKLLQARAYLEKGNKLCQFLSSHSFFQSALSLLEIMEGKYHAAEQNFTKILAGIDPESKSNILLFRAHAFAGQGKFREASADLENTNLIDFATARSKKLAEDIKARYGLGDHSHNLDTKKLDADIAEVEFELLDFAVLKLHRSTAFNSFYRVA